MGFLGRAWREALRAAQGQSTAPQERPRSRRTPVFKDQPGRGRMADMNLALYIIGFEDPSIRPIKIGISNNVKKRLAQLQTGCPWRLEVKAMVLRTDADLFEKYLHAHFDAYRIRPDGEWFLPPDDVTDVVDWVSTA